MTDFFTRCCKKTAPEPGWLRRRLVLAALLLGAALPPAGAQEHEHEQIREMQLERTDAGLFLSATLQMELSDTVESALSKGISMYFVAEAQVLRQRWYWFDKTVAGATRYMRLSYQPLTRRWRLSQSSSPFDDSGLGVSLGQIFESMPEALAAMRRIAGWRIAPADALQAGEPYLVRLQFRLDTSQLPRPLQFGMAGRSSAWTLNLSRTMPLAAAQAGS